MQPEVRHLGTLFHAGFLRPCRMSGLYGQPSLPHNFKGNKSMKLLICTIFAVVWKLSRPIFFILINLPNNEIPQSLDLQD